MTLVSFKTFVLLFDVMHIFNQPIASLNYILQISFDYFTFPINMLFWLEYSDIALSLSKKQKVSGQKRLTEIMWENGYNSIDR